MATPDPSQPLNKPVYEAFALNVAHGNTLAVAWQVARNPDDPEKIKSSSAKSQAFKVAHRPDVAARVEYLMAQRAVPDAPVGVPNRMELMETLNRVTKALVDLFEAAHASGASHVDLTRIKRSTTLHTGRVAAQTTDKLPPLKPTLSLDLKAPLARLIKCECNK